jgi:hypothetical protein
MHYFSPTHFPNIVNLRKLDHMASVSLARNLMWKVNMQLIIHVEERWRAGIVQSV